MKEMKIGEYTYVLICLLEGHHASIDKRTLHEALQKPRTSDSRRLSVVLTDRWVGMHDIGSSLRYATSIRSLSCITPYVYFWCVYSICGLC